ncbi:MAG: SARP family transcriptional regulator, partial [Eggerthellaceae bacterium]|nr:SARP family transcriptional regulator [Eggerthellaceae bacterium]
MSVFISKSACRGNRPDHLLSYRYYQRQRLVTYLLKERGVARFIVAPFGYGKTGLALEYADTIFGFMGVYWINCKSPCFIRDLDEGSIAVDCMRFDPKMRLVVFEDLPFLDAARAEAFSREIDELIEHKHEVLVTCVPSCDAMGRLQQDRVTVSASDLLLDDEELSIVHANPGGPFASMARRATSCRVPALVWCQRQTAA